MAWLARVLGGPDGHEETEPACKYCGGPVDAEDLVCIGMCEACVADGADVEHDMKRESWWRGRHARA